MYLTISFTHAQVKSRITLLLWVVRRRPIAGAIFGIWLRLQLCAGDRDFKDDHLSDDIWHIFIPNIYFLPAFPDTWQQLKTKGHGRLRALKNPKPEERLSFAIYWFAGPVALRYIKGQCYEICQTLYFMNLTHLDHLSLHQSIVSILLRYLYEQNTHWQLGVKNV